MNQACKFSENKIHFLLTINSVYYLTLFEGGLQCDKYDFVSTYYVDIVEYVPVMSHDFAKEQTVLFFYDVPWKYM